MKIMELPEFMADATNVYRTRYYIVRQKIELRDDPEFGRYLFSADTYYLCTPKRDREVGRLYARGRFYLYGCGRERIYFSGRLLYPERRSRYDRGIGRCYGGRAAIQLCFVR